MKEITLVFTGSYCIYKHKDVLCPKNMDTGWVRWDDEDDNNANKKGGSLPEGSYDKDTHMYYCCQTAGYWYNSIELPVVRPFYLLTSNSNAFPKCQMVKWAFSYLEYIVFDTNDQNNGDRQGGKHIFLYGRKLFYCYYEGTLFICTSTKYQPQERYSISSLITAVLHSITCDAIEKKFNNSLITTINHLCFFHEVA